MRAAVAAWLAGLGRKLLDALAVYAALSGPLPHPPPQYFRDARQTDDDAERAG